MIANHILPRGIQIPVAATVAAGFGGWVANYYFPEQRLFYFGLSFGVGVIAMTLFACIESKIYDTAWDSQAYHAEAILALATVWNPVKDSLPTGLAWPTYLNFHAKGPWISAAALYKFSGSYEAGKAFHLVLILAGWLFSLAAVVCISIFKVGSRVLLPCRGVGV